MIDTLRLERDWKETRKKLKTVYRKTCKWSHACRDTVYHSWWHSFVPMPTVQTEAFETSDCDFRSVSSASRFIRHNQLTHIVDFEGKGFTREVCIYVLKLVLFWVECTWFGAKSSARFRVHQLWSWTYPNFLTFLTKIQRPITCSFPNGFSNFLLRWVSQAKADLPLKLFSKIQNIFCGAKQGRLSHRLCLR